MLSMHCSEQHRMMKVHITYPQDIIPLVRWIYVPTIKTLTGYSCYPGYLGL